MIPQANRNCPRFTSKVEASQGASTVGLAARLKRKLSDRYLAGSARITAHRIGGRSGPRDFRRVVVVGPIARQNGLASGARLQHAALWRLGINTELIDAAPALHNPLFRVAHQPGSAYVVHAGGPQSAILLATVLPHAADAYRIAYWAWELPDPPREWAGCERHFDEIWTPSDFAKKSLVQLFDRPIHVVPHHTPARPMRQRDMAKPFTVLAMADSRSSMSRKNPEGALLAFNATFGTSPEARLLLKLNGRPTDLDAFENSFADLLREDNVELIRDYLDDDAMAALYRRADVLLSLHRAEGFGLPMLESMATGVPVVATAWSGNMEFMTPYNSELVPCRLVPVQDRYGMYTDSLWAEPDLNAASRALRRLANDHVHYDRLAAAAYERVVTASPRFPFAVPDTNLIHQHVPGHDIAR